MCKNTSQVEIIITISIENQNRKFLLLFIIKSNNGHVWTCSSTPCLDMFFYLDLDLRAFIISSKDSVSWPPKQSKLTIEAVQISDNARVFICTFLTGNTEPQKLYSQWVQRLTNFLGQDLVFGVTCGQVKTPKHILLPYAIKSLMNNVELIQIIN